jgi:hypothetical protein
MYFLDLSPWNGADDDIIFKNIGWLSSEHPFAKGPVCAGLIAALRTFVKQAWKPWVSGGVHRCEFCPSAGPWTSDNAAGSEIWVPAVGTIYVAPVLILHYIEAHQYKPPDEFIDALMDCPPQRSDAWIALMKPSALFAEHSRLTAR